MSQGTGKTGLASRMRSWMSQHSRSFSAMQVNLALELKPGWERDQGSKALRDFLRRGEISIAPNKNGDRLYLYNKGWKTISRGTLKPKVLKAIYVSNIFTVNDIQRLSEAHDRSHLDKIIKKLVSSGFLRIVGRQVCGHGAGAERQYHVVSREKFRLELL